MRKKLSSYIRQKEIDEIKSVYNLKEKVNGNITLTEALAVERTILSDERTLLAYIRTSIASLISGTSLLEFFHKTPLTILTGWILILLSLGIIVRGVYRYSRLRRVIPLKEN